MQSKRDILKTLKLLRPYLSIGILYFLCLHALQAQHTRLPPRAYAHADSVALAYLGYGVKNLPTLAYNLTHTLSTDAEKFRAIYTWVCTNIENDYYLNEENQRKRAKLKNPVELKAWNDVMSKRMFSQLLSNQRTVCTGYAYLIKELAQFADIPCEIVDGYGRTIQSNVGGTGRLNHSWNAVQLDDVWYLCDATWSSGAVDTEKREFVKNYDDCYFLADPALFIRNHYPADTAMTMLRTKPTLSEFLGAPLIYKGAFRHHLEPVYPAILEVSIDKGDSLTFQIRRMDPSSSPTLTLAIGKLGSIQLAESSPAREENNIVHLTHAFSYKGRYAVHVMASDELIVSYDVTVK